jgi:PKD repeat protein
VAHSDHLDLSRRVTRRAFVPGRGLLVGITCLALSACGGGGGGGGDEPNAAPIVRFTATPTCGQAPMTVSFDASGSVDADGSITSYSWIFGDGSSGTGATISHVYATAGSFNAALTVTDNDGASATLTVPITTIAGPLPATVSVSGNIEFERVPFASVVGDGLDYTRTFVAPAREVEVQLVRSSDGMTLGTTAVTNAQGQYQLAAPINTDVFVRARAVSRPAAPQSASWNIQVRNNTNGNALYVLDGSSFYSCVVNQTRNLRATTGWGGGFAGEYTGTRAAAPFAILDTSYAAARFVIAQGGTALQLPALNVYWSERNVPVDGDVTQGEIGTTGYVAGNPDVPTGIYVLGAEDNDTDEFDEHIVAHEFQHYLEDAVSRTDTVGGPHSLSERLDMRVAFSEGYANAFSAMVLADPLYRDSYGSSQGDDFHFSVESTPSEVPGWYNEASVQRIAWDLFDDVNDGNDAVSLGFGPMFDVFRDELLTGVPLSSLFSFNTALKQRAGVPDALVDQLVEAEQVPGTSLGIVSTTMDAYATTETHSGVAEESEDLVLPVYTPITLGGAAVRLCSSDTLETGTEVEQGGYNKLGIRRFLRFNVPSPRTIRVTVTCSESDLSCAGDPVPNPDFFLSRASTLYYAGSTAPRIEELTVVGASDDYVLEIYDRSHLFENASARRGRTCMTVTIQ